MPQAGGSWPQDRVAPASLLDTVGFLAHPPHISSLFPSPASIPHLPRSVHPIHIRFRTHPHQTTSDLGRDSTSKTIIFVSLFRSFVRIICACLFFLGPPFFPSSCPPQTPTRASRSVVLASDDFHRNPIPTVQPTSHRLRSHSTRRHISLSRTHSSSPPRLNILLTPSIRHQLLHRFPASRPFKMPQDHNSPSCRRPCLALVSERLPPARCSNSPTRHSAIFSSR